MLLIVSDHAHTGPVNSSAREVYNVVLRGAIVLISALNVTIKCTNTHISHRLHT